MLLDKNSTCCLCLVLLFVVAATGAKMTHWRLDQSSGLVYLSLLQLQNSETVE